MIGYPINLNLKNKNCIVIGAGKIAERKIKGLLDAGANITIVALKFKNNVNDLHQIKKIKIIKDKYKKKYLKNKFLVIAATNNKNVNNQICKDAKKLRILSNSINTRKNCDFMNMAVIKKNNFLIAISSNGQATKKVLDIKNKILKVLK